MPTAVINGFHMYYEVHGEGEPFIWIHGSLGGGDGCESFSRLHAAEIAKHYRLILYDRRTAGRSESPADGYSLGAFAEDARGLLRHLGVSRAHVLGSSAGGPIALALALDHPELVHSLVLINTMTYASEPERAARQHELDHAREAERTLGRSGAAEQAVLYRQPTLKADDPVRFQRLYELQLDRFDGICRTIEAYLSIGSSLQDRLHELRLPVFIAHGDADSVIPIRCAFEMDAAIAGSEFHLIEGAGHGLLANEPEFLRRLIEDFLDRFRQPHS